MDGWSKVSVDKSVGDQGQCIRFNARERSASDSSVMVNTNNILLKFFCSNHMIWYHKIIGQKHLAGMKQSGPTMTTMGIISQVWNPGNYMKGDPFNAKANGIHKHRQVDLSAIPCDCSCVLMIHAGIPFQLDANKRIGGAQCIGVSRIVQLSMNCCNVAYIMD